MKTQATLTLVATVFLSASAVTAKASTAGWNPFGDVTPTGIGNIPQGPNPILGYPALHLSAVDLYQAEGTPVYSVRAGFASIVNLPSPEDWTTTIQVKSVDGLLTYFMHLDPNSVSSNPDERSKTGAWVTEGTYLGRLTKAPAPLHSHVHFGVADCKRRRGINPLGLLAIKDTEAPKILAILAEKKGIDQGETLTGKVDLTAEAVDTIDGMAGNFAPNRIEFSIRPLFGNRAPIFKTVLFDATEYPFLPKIGVSHSPETNFDCEHFDEFDGYTPRIGMTLYRWRKYDPAHPEAQLSFALTANTQFLSAADRTWIKPHEGPWDTTLVLDGRYEIKVTASDIRGNRTTKRRVFEVQNSQSRL
jgi:hypothetical protein